MEWHKSDYLNKMQDAVRAAQMTVAARFPCCCYGDKGSTKKQPEIHSD